MMERTSSAGWPNRSTRPRAADAASGSRRDRSG
jgi:hypothetical protein